MKSHLAPRAARRAVTGAVTLSLGLALTSVGCGTSSPPPAASAGEMPLPDRTVAASSGPRADADWRDDVPLAPRAHVDTSACEPAGKSIVVVAREADGRPSRWRYFATRHGRRTLTCEAADANGDGKIDARYFYDSSGRLVLEQRDLDFDGHAEVTADYSQFQPRRRLVRAHALR